MSAATTAPGLPPMLDMRGRRVMVTGAAGSMGRATALVLDSLGADLVLVDLQDLSETRALLTGPGAVELRQGDLSDDGFVDALVAGAPCYGLAHCAAIFRPPADLPPGEGFDRVMRINVRAPLRLAWGLIGGMAARREGQIVIVGSAAGRNGGIMADNSDLYYAEYAASKGGLHTLVKWMARRAVTSGVMVNGIAPGFVTSALNADAGIVFDPAKFFMPLGRAGRAEELGWPIALMCTPAASFIAGVVLDVNGGSYVP